MSSVNTFPHPPARYAATQFLSINNLSILFDTLLSSAIQRRASHGQPRREPRSSRCHFGQRSSHHFPSRRKPASASFIRRPGLSSLPTRPAAQFHLRSQATACRGDLFVHHLSTRKVPSFVDRFLRFTANQCICARQVLPAVLQSAQLEPARGGSVLVHSSLRNAVGSRYVCFVCNFYSVVSPPFNFNGNVN